MVSKKTYAIIPPSQKRIRNSFLYHVGAKVDSVEHWRQLSRDAVSQGLLKKKHLRASHIKPWRDSSNSERLDGHNGLLLTPHIDHLFDQGYISFTDSGEIILSGSLSHEVAQAFGVRDLQPIGRFNDAQKTYLAYHREKVLIHN